MALLVVAVCLKADMAQPNEHLNIGFSRSIVGGVNENDALAVMKVWATELMVYENYYVNVQPKIYADAKEIKKALKQNQVDFIAFTTNDFFEFQSLLDHKKFVFPVYEGRIAEDYLLMVRKNSPVKSIKDLMGGSLIFLKNARTAVAVTWLDVELVRLGMSATKHFFNRMKPASKISDAILPLFFGKEDACLVTRKGFEIMAELNPQISHRLKILMASKGYIPGCLAFRKGFQSKIKEIILNRIEFWNQVPSGHQILTIFQVDALVPRPIEILGPTMEMIKEHRQLFGAELQIFQLESKANFAALKNVY
nr:PhnD/SsuA/transferrin family substrate-binding protein [uncultured Desulfobacter sp.]